MNSPQDFRQMTADTLGKDLLGALVSEIKLLPDPWQKLSKAKQDDVIDRLRARVESNVKMAVHMLAAEGRVTIADAMEQIILTGEITIPQDFGYFPTPALIVARLLELADIEPGMEALEPSAGRGNIASAVAEITDVDCVELLPANVEALLSAGFARAVIMSDFLALVPAPTYDRVVMNPPFARQDDIRHVQHALRFLKPDGRLVSVMAASILFRDNRLTADFRALIDERGGDIEECPEGAFKESGTMVRTVIVTIPGEAV